MLLKILKALFTPNKDRFLFSLLGDIVRDSQHKKQYQKSKQETRQVNDQNQF